MTGIVVSVLTNKFPVDSLIAITVSWDSKKTLNRPPSGVHSCHDLPCAVFLCMSDQKIYVYISKRTLNSWSHGNQMNFNWWFLLSHQKAQSVILFSFASIYSGTFACLCRPLLVFFYLSNEPGSVFRHNVTLIAWCKRLCSLYQDTYNKTGLNLGCEPMNQSALRGFLGTETTVHPKTSPVPPSLPLYLYFRRTYTNSLVL